MANSARQSTRLRILSPAGQGAGALIHQLPPLVEAAPRGDEGPFLLQQPLAGRQNEADAPIPKENFFPGSPLTPNQGGWGSS